MNRIDGQRANLDEGRPPLLVTFIPGDEVAKRFVTECEKGRHDLEEVLRQRGIEVDDVVRWCRTCGSIVVDEECDRKVYPGQYREMTRPAILGPTDKEEMEGKG